MKIVRSLEELAASEGETVRVEGHYRQHDVRKRRHPPPVYAGHAVVVLADGTHVAIEGPYDAAARRDPAEIERCEGALVAIVGMARQRSPSPDDPHRAHFTMPCVLGVGEVTVEGLSSATTRTSEDP